MAMESELSRRQFWGRAQQALDEIERLQAECDAIEAQAVRNADEVLELRAELAALKAAPLVPTPLDYTMLYEFASINRIGYNELCAVVLSSIEAAARGTT